MQHATAAGALVRAAALDPSQLAAVAFLSRYGERTRQHYSHCLELYFSWCSAQELDPLRDVKRIHVELYVRYLTEVRGNVPATVVNRLAPVRGFYRFAAIDEIIDRSPAEYIRLPKVHRDPAKFTGMSRIEMARFLSTSKLISPQHAALAHLMGLLALRVSEACGVDVESFHHHEGGYQVLRYVAKGGKPAMVPITVPLLRTLEAAQGDRTTGPLLLRKKDGTRLDRDNAAAMVDTIARHACLGRKLTPHAVRRAAITNALDAGVSLRDAQGLAQHVDPRTTNLYDVSRFALDRHATHILTAYVAGVA